MHIADDEVRPVVVGKRRIAVRYQLAVERFDSLRLGEPRLHCGDDLIKGLRTPRVGQAAQPVDAQKQFIVERFELILRGNADLAALGAGERFDLNRRVAEDEILMRLFRAEPSLDGCGG